MGFTVLVPARMGSTRLPGKPLVDIAGIPMVVRVARRAAASAAERVVVAADTPAIIEACHAYGVEAVLTRQDHATGSDRLAESCELLRLADEDLVVNVQGDEPLIDPALIDSVAALLEARAEASISTAAHPITDVADFASPNVVKVVVDAQGLAMYFSRAPVPWWRDGFARGVSALPPAPALRHVGIYGYRARFLRAFPHLTPAAIEVTEALEQLRAMWHGYRIAVHVAARAPGPGVDTPDDLARVRALFARPSR